MVRSRRLLRGFDRLLELVPHGFELGAVRDMVEGDLVGDDALADIVGGAGFVGRSDIPRIRPILVAIAARATGASEVDEEALDALRSNGEAQALSRELVGQIPTEEDWLDHADAHTGALFAFCCRAGGHLSGAPARELLALGRFGRHFGRMWHVAEDVSVLDHGEPALHLLARAAAGRPVLPVVFACESDPGIGERWKRLATEGDPDQARALADALRHIGVARSRELMVQESWRARRAIRVLPNTRYRVAMERLAAQLAKAGARKQPAGPDEEQSGSGVGTASGSEEGSG